MSHDEDARTLEVTFDLHADDVLAFTRHTCQRSRAMGLLTKGGYAVILLLMLSGDAIQLWARRLWPWEYLAPVVAWQVLELVLFLSVYYLLLRWVMKFTTLRVTKEGRNEGILCKHRVVIDAESLFESTDVGEQRVKWRGVERVEEGEGHIFIYIGSSTAFIIPKWAFATNRQSEEFFEAARAYQLRAA